MNELDGIIVPVAGYIYRLQEVARYLNELLPLVDNPEILTKSLLQSIDQVNSGLVDLRLQVQRINSDL